VRLEGKQYAIRVARMLHLQITQIPAPGPMDAAADKESKMWSEIA
jgi:hypothetical protein